MKKIVVILLVVLLVGCSKKKDSIPLESIGKSYVKLPKSNELSVDNYSLEANSILEKHKEKLKILLPILISDQINIYKNILLEIEKAPIKTLSYDGTNQYINQELFNLKNRLLEKEILLNNEYFKLFNELSLLNFKYRSSKTNDEFIDCYDSGPIVLSEEVMIKIEEMIKDEKIRIALENKVSTSQKAGYGLDALLTLIKIPKCGKTLKSITVGVKASTNKLFLQSAANTTSKVTYLLLNENLSKSMAYCLKNQKKRDYISNKAEKGFYVLLGLDAVNDLYKYDTSQSFKVINNQINGRIGDFSDGILTVHLQKVRDIIKLNSAMIK